MKSVIHEATIFHQTCLFFHHKREKMKNKQTFTNQSLILPKSPTQNYSTPLTL